MSEWDHLYTQVSPPFNAGTMKWDGVTPEKQVVNFPQVGVNYTHNNGRSRIINRPISYWPGEHGYKHDYTVEDSWVPPDDLPIIKKRQMFESFGDITGNALLLVRIVIVCLFIYLVWCILQKKHM